MTSAADRLVITDLADENALLRERVESLEHDVVRYRELAQVALAQLQELTATIERERRAHARVRDEYCALRQRLLNEAEAA